MRREKQTSVNVWLDMDVILQEINDEILIAECASRKLAINCARYTKRDLIEAINSGDRVHCGIVIASIFGEQE